jgi:hypothetical protein
MGPLAERSLLKLHATLVRNEFFPMFIVSDYNGIRLAYLSVIGHQLNAWE